MQYEEHHRRPVRRPYAVINASLYGVITEGKRYPDLVGCVYGMHNGIEGFLKDDYENLSET